MYLATPLTFAHDRRSSTLWRAMFAGVPAPMLARLDRRLPRGPGWCFEPKFDGFRGLLWRPTIGGVRLLSRNLKDLGHAFPELVRAGEGLPADTLVDGEIVIADEQGRSDFGALQRRLGAGHRDARRVAHEQPAVLLAFDALRDAAPRTSNRGNLQRSRRVSCQKWAGLQLAERTIADA